jgi:hypothetical protein
MTSQAKQDASPKPATKTLEPQPQAPPLDPSADTGACLGSPGDSGSDPCGGGGGKGDKNV